MSHAYHHRFNVITCVNVMLTEIGLWYFRYIAMQQFIIYSFSALIICCMYVVIQGATHAQSSPDSASTWIFKLIIVLLLMTAMYPGSIGEPYPWSRAVVGLSACWDTCNCYSMAYKTHCSKLYMLLHVTIKSRPPSIQLPKRRHTYISIAKSFCLDKKGTWTLEMASLWSCCIPYTSAICLPLLVFSYMYYQ